MPKPVIMPKLGFTQESAQIVKWLKHAGDAVEQGDPILEVTTDKVNMEVESPATGILDGLRYQEGDTVPVTEVIAQIRAANEPPMAAVPAQPSQPGAHVPAQPLSPSATPTAASLSPSPPVASIPVQPSQSATPAPTVAPQAFRATPIAANFAQAMGLPLERVPGTGPGGRVTRGDVEGYAASHPRDGKTRAVPAARRLATELGVSLADVHGTGPRGRVQSADVQAMAAVPASPDSVAPQPTAATASLAGVVPSPDEGVLEIIPLTGMRLTIAQRMQQSVNEAPHITLEADIDVTAAEALRARANELLSKDAPRISLTAVIARASAWALKRNLLLNSRLSGRQIQVLRAINIGIAVALEPGLIVPVVHGADGKGLAALAAEIAELAARAREGRLRITDVSGGTFSLSNLGMFGVDRFTAIINPPETAILAVGRVTWRIVPDAEGRATARPLMTVTLSADHRVVDGAVAGRFLNDLRQVLEHPELLIL